MASTDLIRDAVDAALDQRYPGTSAQPARFALVLNARDDPVARAQAIAGVLEPIGATIEPLWTLDRGVPVATLPDRAFAGPNGAAFAAAHRFQEVFDLEAADPDLPTDLFPVDIVPDEFVEQDAEGFPAECWAPAEASLPAAWAITSITAREAWTFSHATQRPARGTGAIVAQPDTGITAHAQLADISVVPGFEVLDNDADPTDPLDGANPGHGTATASVVVSGPAGTVTGAPGASLLSATDFDLDRERESAAAPAGLGENVALGVASLAAEEIRLAAALQDPPDWYLDNAVRNPVLRDAVGLGGAETEAGTGVGTGVEGGGR
jgi:serine protease